MTRRIVLAATALAILGGAAGPALASGVGTSHDTDGRDAVCVSLNNSQNGDRDGICVWYPSGIVPR